jgi:uncharacterized membrane protein
MVKIKQLISADDHFYSYFLEYFTRSKPYDFCESKSFSLRKHKIKEYLQTMVEDSIIYQATIDSETVGYVVFSQQTDHLILEFVIGDNQFAPRFLMQVFYDISLLAQKTFDKQIIKSTIQRKNKRKNFLNWIKRYDKACEITQSNNITEITWTYDRLNLHCRNK